MVLSVTRLHLFSTVSERGIHLVDSFFIYNFLCKIVITMRSIGCPKRGSPRVDGRPYLNSFIPSYIVLNDGADVT